MNSDIKELTSEIGDLVAQMKKVETNVAIVKFCFLYLLFITSSKKLPQWNQF